MTYDVITGIVSAFFLIYRYASRFIFLLLCHSLIFIHASHTTLRAHHSLVPVLIVKTCQYLICIKVEPKSTEFASTAFIRRVWATYASICCSMRPRKDHWTCSQFSKSCLGTSSCGRGSRASTDAPSARSSVSLPAFQWEEESFQLEMIVLLRD